MPYRPGRHFLQIPGPTNVPDRVLRAMARPTIDHRGPEFQALGRELLDGIRDIFRTERPVTSIQPPAPAHGRRRWSTRSRPVTAC